MPDRRVGVRRSKPDNGIEVHTLVIVASAKNKSLIMRYLASQYLAKNDKKSAKSSLTNMVEVSNKN